MSQRELKFSGGIGSEFPHTALGIFHPPKGFWEINIPPYLRKTIAAAVFSIVSSVPSDGFSQENKGGSEFDVAIACTVATSNQIGFILPQERFDIQEALLRCTSYTVSQILYPLSQEDFEAINYSDAESFDWYQSVLQSEDFKKKIYPFIAEYYALLGQAPSWEMQLMFVDLFIALQENDTQTQENIIQEIEEKFHFLPLEPLLIKFGFSSL